MSPPISATEEELERFFGVSAVRSDVDVPWPYVGVAFGVVRDRFNVQCDILPSYRGIKLQVELDGQLLYQLSAPRLDDIKVHVDPAHDTLELVVSPVESIFLRLVPSVQITQQAWDGT